MLLLKRSRRQSAKARTDLEAEQLRLGNILFSAVNAAANENVATSGTIGAGYVKDNKRFSVFIKYRAGTDGETTMHFDIELHRGRLMTRSPDQDGPEFTMDRFDEFVETARDMVLRFG